MKYPVDAMAAHTLGVHWLRATRKRRTCDGGDATERVEVSLSAVDAPLAARILSRTLLVSLCGANARFVLRLQVSFSCGSTCEALAACMHVFRVLANYSRQPIVCVCVWCACVGCWRQASWAGFRIENAKQASRAFDAVRFASAGNIGAIVSDQGREGKSPWLRYGRTSQHALERCKPLPFQVFLEPELARRISRPRSTRLPCPRQLL